MLSAIVKAHPIAAAVAGAIVKGIQANQAKVAEAQRQAQNAAQENAVQEQIKSRLRTAVSDCSTPGQAGPDEETHARCILTQMCPGLDDSTVQLLTGCADDAQCVLSVLAACH